MSLVYIVAVTLLSLYSFISTFPLVNGQIRDQSITLEPTDHCALTRRCLDHWFDLARYLGFLRDLPFCDESKALLHASGRVTFSSIHRLRLYNHLPHVRLFGVQYSTGNLIVPIPLPTGTTDVMFPTSLAPGRKHCKNCSD